MLNIKIEERQNGKTAVLKLEGTIDTPLFDQVSNEVKRELKHGKYQVIIDLSGVTYINNFGILDLLRCKEHMLFAGGILKICGVSQDILRMIDALGVIGLLNIETTLNDAIKSLARSK